jgi:hypothetical protein
MPINMNNRERKSILSLATIISPTQKSIFLRTPSSIINHPCHRKNLSQLKFEITNPLRK